MRKDMLWNGTSLEEIDIVRLVDELVAYAITYKTRLEALPDDMAYAQPLRGYAYNLLLRAVPDIFDEVDRHGFFNIEGAPYILELEKDAAYQKAMEERNK